MVSILPPDTSHLKILIFCGSTQECEHHVARRFNTNTKRYSQALSQLLSKRHPQTGSFFPLRIRIFDDRDTRHVSRLPSPALRLLWHDAGALIRLSATVLRISVSPLS